MGCPGRVGLGPGPGPGGEAKSSRLALPPVCLQAAAVPRLPELGVRPRPVSPVRSLAFSHIWTDYTAVGQPRAPHASLIAIWFSRDRGLIPEPPGQLNEAVIRSFSVGM